jgi:hypothetical protein
MANIKLDFSKMKHIRSNAHSTTLKHPDGHEITLSHKALGPDNRKQLLALASGGAIKAEDKQPHTHDTLSMPLTERTPMADGGKVDNAVSPDNAYNQYVQKKGIVGGTVYDGSEHEHFLFGDYCFDIDKAREISNKTANAELPVSSKWIDKTKLNKEQAMSSTSTNPVFIAQIHTPNGLKPLLIDGNHRMYKAVQEGKTSLPAHIFTPEQTTELFVKKPKEVSHPGKEKMPNDAIHPYAEGGFVRTKKEMNAKGIQMYAKGGMVDRGTVYTKMADGGKVSDEDYNKMIQKRTQQYDPTPQPSPTPTAWQQFEEGAHQFGQNIKQAVGAQAEGGQIKKPEAKIDYSEFTSQQRGLPRGGATTLNYKDLKKQYREKARQPMAYGGVGTTAAYTPNHTSIPTITGQAEGGHPGMGHPAEETCQACGGPIRKAYADQDADEQPVSQDDSAPEVPANLDPGTATQTPPSPEAMVNAVVPQYAPQQQAVQPDTSAIMPAPTPTPASATTPKTPMEDYAANKAAIKTNLNEHAAHFQADLNTGKVTPETYQDLFNKQGTLGKIGTIFGLLVSGAGAGLTHQPNMMMELMNKTIQNDFDAQKFNKEWQLHQAQIQNMGIDTQQKYFALQQAAKFQASYHKLVTDTMKMPEGPAKEAAKQQLGILYQGVAGKINDLNDAAAGASAYQKMLFPEQTSAGTDEQSFQNRVKGMQMLGEPGQARAKYMMEHHIPGVPGESSEPVDDQTRKQVIAMNVLDNKGKDLLNFIDQNKGTWNPNKLATARQKVEEMKNFYNDSINGGALTEGRLSWYDEQFKKDPTGIINNLLGSTAKLREMVNSNATRRDLLLKGQGFPETKQLNGHTYTKGKDNNWHLVK